MFENIGSKIKTMAVVMTIIGIIASVIGGFGVLGANSSRNPTILPGILIIVGGCLGSWLGSFMLYGFGQLIEDLGECKEYLHMLSHTQSAPLAGGASRTGSDTWLCSCGKSNSSRYTNCLKCGRHKP